MPPNPKPAWLGDLLILSDFGGDDKKYLDHLHSLFWNDFFNTGTQFNGKPVACDNKSDGGRCASFVHVTTDTDPASGERKLSMRRCERIAWIKQILDNHPCPEILYWEKVYKGNKLKSHLYLAQERYIVILEDRGAKYFLASAIYVDYESSHLKHLKEHAKYQQTRAAP